MMNILVTGAAGFVGRNLVCRLKNIRDGKAPAIPGVEIEDIMEVDLQTPPRLLEEYCGKADFVFNLAGVNRPVDPEDFRKGNRDFAGTLLENLRKMGNNAPVMLASSIQATLEGRYAGSPYGETKRQGEELFFEHGRRTGAPILIYRFPNLFGKWCRPNYNSVVATFCHNIARGLDIRIDNPEAELELLHIDDLLTELTAALARRENRVGDFCVAGPTFHTTVGNIARLLKEFKDQPRTLLMPRMVPGSFESRLYSTYLSYLEPDDAAFELHPNVDNRGSFTEFMRLDGCGQMSVNISEPGIVKGEHWHDSKWEQFLVVAGHGLIRMRHIDSEEIHEFEVSADKPTVVTMLPGYTHSLVNLSPTERMVTLIWANEPFNPQAPDTYRLPVGENPAGNDKTQVC